MNRSSKKAVWKRRDCSAFTWIELLVILTIALVVARLAVPVLFPQLFHTFDQAVARALGISEATRVVVATAAVLVFLLWASVRVWRYWRHRWLTKRDVSHQPWW